MTTDELTLIIGLPRIRNNAREIAAYVRGLPFFSRRFEGDAILVLDEVFHGYPTLQHAKAAAVRDDVADRCLCWILPSLDIAYAVWCRFLALNFDPRMLTVEQLEQAMRVLRPNRREAA
jgi:hypothetical protein